MRKYGIQLVFGINGGKGRLGEKVINVVFGDCVGKLDEFTLFFFFVSLVERKEDFKNEMNEVMRLLFMISVISNY